MPIPPVDIIYVLYHGKDSIPMGTFYNKDLGKEVAKMLGKSYVSPEYIFTSIEQFKEFYQLDENNIQNT